MLSVDIVGTHDRIHDRRALPLIGSVISHYHVLEKPGAGGTDVVYKAQYIRLGRFVGQRVRDLAPLGQHRLC